MVDPKTGVEQQEGETGELWIAGPTIAAGYYGKPQLSEETFRARLQHSPDDCTYLRTGDLAFVQQGHMFICGRMKDLIIVNGANYYPQDLEFCVQDASPAVRPGCVAAFAASEVEKESSVVVVFEIRRELKAEAETVCGEVRRALLCAIGLPISRVVAIEERTIPKTTSGKIQRRATRAALHDGTLKIVHKSLSSGERNVAAMQQVPPMVLLDCTNKQTTEDTLGTKSLPDDCLPEQVHQAIERLTCDAGLLESNFLELGVPALAADWAVVTKTTEAMREMCRHSLQALARDYPTICQLSHALCENPEWLQRDDLEALLSQVAHCAFVLQWVTTTMMEDAGKMKAKLVSDADAERDRFASCPAEVIPDELIDALGLQKVDRLFGKITFFGWIKHRSAQALAQQTLRNLESDDTVPDAVPLDRLKRLNILEAIWTDTAHGFTDNAEVGSWLSRHEMSSTRAVHPNWEKLYIAWNACVCAWISNENTSHWILSKLLIPCIVDAQNDSFLLARAFSLYLISQRVTTNWVTDSSANLNGVLCGRAVRLFGHLNRDLGSKLGLDDCNLATPEVLDAERSWFEKFDRWSGRRKVSDDRLSGPMQSDNLSVDSFQSIINGILGAGVDESRTWGELGLSSMAAVELESQIADRLQVTLPQGFQDKYPNPRSLRAYIASNNQLRIPVKVPALQITGSNISWTVQGLLQGIGIILLALLVAASFSPAYSFWSCISSSSSSAVLLPLVPLVWFFTFSIMVIVTKWIVIGRYKEQAVAVPSTSFCRWWFVDRLLSLWETWVGNLIKDTPLISLFYVCMGARIHPSARINAFIRESDLVEIGALSELNYGITCRRFSPWDVSSGVSLRFRPTNIQLGCKVQGLVGLGSKLDDGSHVDRQSAVPEGGQVPPHAYVQGNPAYYTGPQKQEDQLIAPGKEVFALGVLKLVWLVLELYICSSILFCAGYLLKGMEILYSFRYGSIIFWILLILISTLLSMAACILLKWILIGKKKPGTTSRSLYSAISNWIVDFQFNLSLFVLDALFENTKLINVYLVLLGMDIDMASKVWALHFPPSVVDLVTVRRTFFSAVTIEPDHNGQLQRIEAIDSSFGHSVVLKGGAKVTSSQVAPYSCIDSELSTGKELETPTIPKRKLHCELWSVVLVLALGLSSVPVVEIAKLQLGASPVLGFNLFQLALAFIVLTLVWLFLFAILQRVVLCQKMGPSKVAKEWAPLNRGLYDVYMTVSYFLIWRYSLLQLTFGTPIMNAYLKVLGATIKGRLIYFAGSSYDFQLLTFMDRTVLDRCVISGHSLAGRSLNVGRNICAGTIHEGTVALCCTDMTGAIETGPCRFVAQNIPRAFC